ncbi:MULTISPECIES: hypothetical protein [Ramlibacter]|uniref:Uncharacterized protein n=1 Tax=Ramlibacter pinisoli TaxID=2682844 RepID=A0A6N8J194_9BURK|nr:MULTISPECIES: hypothetical protein [Ramlibacter]MBA2962003.1 hypothetical protein [Ramlibacter sp. CGMCC 1.13660]MVQ31946.1 hypothetical protein [Ramlibacter pinisoli]
MKNPSPDVSKLVQNLVRLTGRDAHGYEAFVLADASIAVRNSTAAAYYPLEGWTSRFIRHLHQGFYDPPHGPTLSRCVEATRHNRGSGRQAAA